MTNAMSFEKVTEKFELLKNSDGTLTLKNVLTEVEATLSEKHGWDEEAEELHRMRSYLYQRIAQLKHIAALKNKPKNTVRKKDSYFTEGIEY